MGLETTLKRPIVNTRDEPHADPHRYRRLHVIVGDANLAEVATFLKLGTTSLVLAMIEDDVSASRSLALADPVRAIHAVAVDRTFTQPLQMADGTTATALDHPVGAVLAGPEVRRRPRARVPRPPRRWARRSLERWEQVLHGLETDPVSLARQVDWVAKLQLLEAYRDRHGCGWDDPPDGRRRPAVPRPAARPGRSSPGWTPSAWCDRGVVAAAVTDPPRGRPVPGSGGSASSGGRRRWPPPTGTPWSSTSVRTPCGASL